MPGIHYTPKACIIRLKICVWPWPDTSWLGNWAFREIRTHYLFNILPSQTAHFQHVPMMESEGLFSLGQCDHIFCSNINFPLYFLFQLCSQLAPQPNGLDIYFVQGKGLLSGHYTLGIEHSLSYCQGALNSQGIILDSRALPYNNMQYEVNHAYFVCVRDILCLLCKCKRHLTLTNNYKLLLLFKEVIFLVLRLFPYALQILAKYFML